MIPVPAHCNFMHDSLIQEMYSPISEIQSELERRKNDPELRAKVKKFLAEYGIPFEGDSPKAFFCRSVMSPNLELSYFLNIAEDLKLEPILLEYPDKFVAKNENKYFLCKMHFSTRTAHTRDGIKIVDFASSEGKKFDELRTTWGDGFIDFHHKLLFKEIPQVKDRIINIFDWFNKSRKPGADYYAAYLALFISNGVLFENFLRNDKEETKFVHEKILPSFKKIYELFRVKPLIFPLLPIEHEHQKSWLTYPESLKQEIAIYLNK